MDTLRRYWITLSIFKAGYRKVKFIVGLMVGLPCLLLAGVYLRGLERVPHGSMADHLLTPEEEDTITSSLAGPDWYQGVIDLLTTPALPIVPMTDWR